MASIVDKKISAYIEENLENAKFIDYSQLTAKDGLVTALYDDLPHLEINGYPVASDFVDAQGVGYSLEEYEKLSKDKQKACKLRYYFLPNTHELYIGTTGSGKTTGCVEPQLRALSSLKNKPNLFLTDPKGELFDRNAQHLKENGYELHVLNFKDIIKSGRWNPLMELYDLNLKMHNAGLACKFRTGAVDKSLELIVDSSSYTKEYIEYNGYAFPDADNFNNYVEFEKNGLLSQIDSMVNQFVNIMIKNQNSKDPSWELGAQELLMGMMFLMLEESVLPNTTFTRDMMTFTNLRALYESLKTPIVTERCVLRNHFLLRDKSDKPRQYMSTALENAPNTMRSYLGVFNSATKNWFMGHIAALTTGNTIDLKFGGKPFAIFLITRDYEKSDFEIAGIFIDWIYRMVLEHVDKTGDTSRALHCLLDEFGNIPEIRDFENKISTSRSRNIWFHISVQSYMQIDNVYKEVRSAIIQDNCNSQIFLGAQNQASKRKFSEQCGEHHIPTLQSTLEGNDHTLTKVPLVPVSQLDLINPGQIYVKRLYKPVMLSQFVRSYDCENKGFYKKYRNGLKTCIPTTFEAFLSNKYVYPRFQPNYKEPKKGVLDDFNI